MSKVKIQIKSYLGKVLFEWESEGNTIKETVSRAVLSGAVLSRAVLSRADLRGADLRGADLSGAVLSRAVLSRADLRGADLRGADLSRAVLSRAVLSDADLSGADLSDADLSGADLSGADLSDADLSGADLSGADLLPIKADLWELVLHAIPEIPALRQSVIDGKVNGSAYEGECACLCGTIANVRKCDYRQLEGITPNSSRPAERFFLAVKTGDTPETNPVSKLVLEWLDELLGLLNISEPTKTSLKDK